MDTNEELGMDHLQEALKNLSFNDKASNEKVVPYGDDLTHLPTPQELIQKNFEAEGEPEPAVEPEPVEEVVKTTIQEVAQTANKQLVTDDDLSIMFTTGIVNGKEVEYSLLDLRNIKQTQDAASLKLEETKALLREAREAIKEEQSVATPAAVAEEDEYLTEEERRVRDLELQIQSVRQHQAQIDANNLNQSEEAFMRSVFEKDGFTEQQAAERISQIVDKFPDAARFAAELFTQNPTTAEDLARRKSTFSTVWQLGKTIEFPEVVRRTATEARDYGRNQAKIDAKRNLTNVPDGSSSADNKEVSRTERIRSIAERGGKDSDWASLLLDGNVYKNL